SSNQKVYISIVLRSVRIQWDHSFSDGNKKIAAFLFVWFLEKNSILYKIRLTAQNESQIMPLCP
ncbi:MAG TPA: Fic family protein, partial [Flavitalea sp.]|nr:Fic family protein [Flavitalea sp.]